MSKAHFKMTAAFDRVAVELRRYSTADTPGLHRLCLLEKNEITSETVLDDAEATRLAIALIQATPDDGPWRSVGNPERVITIARDGKASEHSPTVLRKDAIAIALALIRAAGGK